MSSQMVGSDRSDVGRIHGERQTRTLFEAGGSILRCEVMALTVGAGRDGSRMTGMERSVERVGCVVSAVQHHSGSQT